MERWVNALADDSLHGWLRWYALIHVSGCNQCRATLEGLQRVRERLHALRTAPAISPSALSPEQRVHLNAAFDEIDRQHS